MTFACLACGADSGSSLVCPVCRRSLAGSLQRKVTVLWHDTIVSRAFDPARKLYRCFHCQKWFPRNKVCGDHWPNTKASRPDLRYDVSAGVCSCAFCNTSGASTRTPDPMKKKESKPKTPRTPDCKKLGCKLAGYFNGLCVKHKK